MESTTFTLYQPLGKLVLDSQGILFSLGMIGGHKSRLEYSQIESFQLLAPSGWTPETVTVTLRDGSRIAFIGNGNSSKIHQAIKGFLDSADFSDKASPRRLGGLDESTHTKLRAIYEKSNLKEETLKPDGQLLKKISGPNYGLEIHSSHLFITTGLTFTAGLTLPLNQIIEINRFVVRDEFVFNRCLVLTLENGLRLAWIDTKNAIEKAFSSIQVALKDYSQDLDTPDFADEKSTQLKLSDTYRKYEMRLVDWGGDFVQTQLATASDASELAAFQELKTAVLDDKRLRKRVKATLLLAEKQMSLVSASSEAAANLLAGDFSDSASFRLFSSENSHLFESRKGARVVTRKSSSSSSGGGAGIGVRVGPVGLGGGRYSGSSSSSSRTVYFPAPDELTHIESGRFWVSHEQLTFVGAQFNRQVPFQKLTEIDVSYSQMQIQIVQQGKDKNFVVAFDNQEEFLEATFAVSLVSQLFKELGGKLSPSDLRREMSAELPKIQEVMRAEVVETLEDIGEVMTAAQSPLLGELRGFQEIYLGHD